MSEENEYTDSDLEFIEQKDLADKRIEHIKLIQEKLRTHLSTLETINTSLEQKANNTKDPAERLKIFKSISFNYDRLLKMYDAYQAYEQVIQKYYSNVTDIITRKYKTKIELKKNKDGPDKLDVFKQLNVLLSQNNSDEIESITKIEDSNFKL